MEVVDLRLFKRLMLLKISMCTTHAVNLQIRRAAWLCALRINREFVDKGLDMTVLLKSVVFKIDCE